MFSKKIIWLALLAVYPLCAGASPAKSSVKAHGRAISAEFVPAQDEPFSSERKDKKAASDVVKTDEPQTVKAELTKPEPESKSIPGEAEQIQAFLSPDVNPVATEASVVPVVVSTQTNQTAVDVKAAQLTPAVEAAEPARPVHPPQPVQPVQPIEPGRIDPAVRVMSPVDKPGGPLRVNAKPSNQELQDREQYWQRRGRSDLAAKVRDQIKLLEPQKGNGGVSAVAVPTEKEISGVVEHAPKQEAPVLPKPHIEAAPKSVFPEIKPVPGKNEETARKEIRVPTPVVTPVLAPVVVPVPTQELLTVPAPALISSPKPVVAVARPAPVVKVEGNMSEPPKPEKIYRSVSGTTEPDVKQAKMDLDERNRYWDAHGRSDLVTQTAKPLMQEMRKPAEPVSREVKSTAAESSLKKSATNSQVESPENGSSFVSANPTRQELDERAKYWAARGRTDLSNRVQNQLTEDKPIAPARPVVTTVEPVRPVVAPVRPVIAPVAAPVVASVAERGRSGTRGVAGETEQVSTELAKPTSQELDDGAQYWEARGRSDLASQLRQKLQTLEPRHATVPRNTIQTPTVDFEKTKYNQNVAKNALEDALLKNPNSTQARLDLAQIYQGAGEFNKARGLIDGVLAGSPDLPVALYSSAQLYAEQRLWRETMFTLEKISPVSRNDEMSKLQKTAWAHVQIDRADVLVRQGNNRAAELLLRQVAVELAVNDNQRAQPQIPTLWKSVMQKKAKH